MCGHIKSFNFETMRRNASWRQRLVFRVLPAHVWAQVRFEILAWRVRRHHRSVEEKLSGMRDILANIGAGAHAKQGWVNLDIVKPQAELSFAYDCRRRLPFDDGSVAAIFTEHFVEHLDYTEEAPRFFRECFRSLRSGGVLRVVVPDGGRYLKAYAQQGWDALSEVRELGECRSDKYFRNQYACKMELINTVFRQGYQHKWIYDCENMAWVLHQFGFAEVAQSHFGVSRHEELAIDRPERAHESLYVEAIRP